MHIYYIFNLVFYLVDILLCIISILLNIVTTLASKQIPIYLYYMCSVYNPEILVLKYLTAVHT